jgi:hypothetical protein
MTDADACPAATQTAEYSEVCGRTRRGFASAGLCACARTAQARFIAARIHGAFARIGTSRPRHDDKAESKDTGAHSAPDIAV